VVSTLGIFGTLCACAYYAESRAAAALAWVGERSVFIYLMHFTILIYLRNAIEIVGLPQHALVELAMAAAAITISLGVGIWIIDPYFPFLLRAPWLQSRRKPAAVAAT
jgi:fucose 4-O-acetylase-like acetyltransferase